MAGQASTSIIRHRLLSFQPLNIRCLTIFRASAQYFLILNHPRISVTVRVSPKTPLRGIKILGRLKIIDYFGFFLLTWRHYSKRWHAYSATCCFSAICCDTKRQPIYYSHVSQLVKMSCFLCWAIARNRYNWFACQCRTKKKLPIGDMCSILLSSGCAVYTQWCTDQTHAKHITSCNMILRHKTIGVGQTRF